VVILFFYSIVSDFERPQKPGFPELPIIADFDIGLRIAFFLRFAAVSDQTVLPRVDHRDLQSVPVGLERIGHFHPEGLGPDDADVLAIELDGCDTDILDFVELQPVTLTMWPVSTTYF